MYSIRNCWTHGQGMFKLGFCIQCIRTQKSLAAIALQQLERQRAAHPEVSTFDEETPPVLSPTLPRLAS